MLKNLKKLLRIYTQKEIAIMLGYKSKSTISMWIKNKKVPVRMTARLAKEVSKCH